VEISVPTAKKYDFHIQFVAIRLPVNQWFIYFIFVLEMEEQAMCQENKRYQSIQKNQKEFEIERQAHLNGENLSSSSFIHEAQKNVLYETLEKRLERRSGRTQKGEFMESKFLDR
jgi:hypothetical protein